jgi:hypothetical protein
MVRLFFAMSTEVYSASAILFIFSYRAGRDTEYQPRRWRGRKPWTLLAILDSLHELKQTLSHR